MASRETGPGAAGTYYHSGKLIALDTVVRVLTNPMHDWDYIRPELAIHLREALCLTILRNCKSPYASAVSSAVKLLCAVMHASSLRANLRAEIGALYPLVLLRPLETPVKHHASHSQQALAAVKGLEKLCSSPQMLVDIFINYDCNLQSSNLFERTINAIGREASNRQNKEVGMVAKNALLACIQSLDTWAGPLRPWLGNDTDSYGSQSSDVLGHVQSKDSNTIDEDVLRKLYSDKAKKSSLHEGISFFNSDPVKGMQYFEDSGVVESDSKSKALFLLEHARDLDPEAIGELLGHHGEDSIEVCMFAFLQ